MNDRFLKRLASRPDKTPSSGLALQIAELVRRSSSETSSANKGEPNAEQQERKSKGAKEDRPELTKKKYERELRKLQTKLVEMQEWVIANRTKVVVVFEGRDAAGKGGVIHRIMERVSPRVLRHVALPAPTEREKTNSTHNGT